MTSQFLDKKDWPLLNSVCKLNHHFGVSFDCHVQVNQVPPNLNFFFLIDTVLFLASEIQYWGSKYNF